MKELMPVETCLILNMLDNIFVKCKTFSQTGIQRGNFKDHLKRCRKTIMCSCSVPDIQYPWVGQKDQLFSYLSRCLYEQIRPVLS
ncbi:unnamed protein product [Adineta steineri]|uniref:Uncharacterized protein n=1 Tax=Adineta steineri TaxID=433720 RepID=A0A815N5J9_9BILA|nr:unnamed protein product [Adineta steineri]CAF1433667.1 unnamed protein product [Adineta steineri]CAF1625133.1 unnamed protein product [Adineta steineri]CAF1625267.1 unnamed protein product [Adineta steineri]